MERSTHFQVDNMKKFLSWLETCECEFTVSSMQGGFIHVRFFIPIDKSCNEEVIISIPKEEKE